MKALDLGKKDLTLMHGCNKWFIIKILVITAIAAHSSQLTAQSVEILTSGRKSSLRGLSVVSDKVIWVSGSNGNVGKSVDSGKTWKWYTVKGFEDKDFRDIEAFDEKTAIIMSVAEPAYLLKTFNGGESWKVVFTDTTKGMFLDAMEFWNSLSGIVVGDPIDGKIFVTRTFDGGNIWVKLSRTKLPAVDSGEAIFAASGTNVRKLDINEACIVTGGKKSRLLIRNRLINIPIVQGTESTGANSVAVWGRTNKAQQIVVVGGDFAHDTISTNNCFYTHDLGRTWKAPKQNPHGYRSCVEFITKTTLITCGTSGVDVSENSGASWQLISNESFHVCRKAKDGKAVFLAGVDGKIARLHWK
jgi:photosystem II stability/assembly factor-like uncharacterized protein